MDAVPSSQPPPKDIWPAQNLRRQNNFDVIGARESVSMPLHRNSTAATGSGSGLAFSPLVSDIQTPISAPISVPTAPYRRCAGDRGGGGIVPDGEDTLPGEISYQFPSQSICPTTFTPTIGRFSYPALRKSRVMAGKQKSVASVGEITGYCPYGRDNDNSTSSTSAIWSRTHANVIQEGTVPDRFWNEDDITTTSMCANDSPILANFPVPPAHTSSSSIDLSGQKSIEKKYKGRDREARDINTMAHDHHPNRPSQRDGAAVFEGKTVVPRRILTPTQQFDSHLPYQETIHSSQDPAAIYYPQRHQYRHDDLPRMSIHDPEYEKTMGSLSDPRGYLLEAETQAQAQANTEIEAEIKVETKEETDTEERSLQEQQYHLTELHKRSYAHAQVLSNERTSESGSGSGSGSVSGDSEEVQTNRKESRISQYSTNRKSYLDDYRAQQKLLQQQQQQQQQKQ
ncbi:hypothetical protein BGZ51_002817 [Haplosporangium sp. Z 767]|nr:hypothetical protein BGZ51_002817 [Haplosporangium sp. Z 767]